MLWTDREYMEQTGWEHMGQWKLREVRWGKAKHPKASGADPVVSHWRRKDGFS